MAKLIAVILLAVLAGCAADPERQHVAVLNIKLAGPSQFSFENGVYMFPDLVSKIRSEYSTVGYIDADMGSAPSIGELLQACALQQQTGFPVRAHYNHEGKTSDITCK